MPNFLVGLLNAVQAIEILWFKNLNSWSLLLTMRQGTKHSKIKNITMKSLLAAVKRQRFPAWAGQWVCGLFILGLGFSYTASSFLGRVLWCCIWAQFYEDILRISFFMAFLFGWFGKRKVDNATKICFWWIRTIGSSNDQHNNENILDIQIGRSISIKN